MKFISRSSNYMLVLRPGIQGNHLTGTPAQPGLSIRFRDGIVEVKDEEVIRLMKASDGFKNGDFIAVDEDMQDPYADERVQIEPVHVVTEMKYGHPEARKVSDSPVRIPASIKKMIAVEAQKMAKEMVKEMIPQIIKELSTTPDQDSTKKEVEAPSKKVSPGKE